MFQSSKNNFLNEKSNENVLLIYRHDVDDHKLSSHIGIFILGQENIYLAWQIC